MIRRYGIPSLSFPGALFYFDLLYLLYIMDIWADKTLWRVQIAVFFGVMATFVVAIYLMCAVVRIALLGPRPPPNQILDEQRYWIVDRAWSSAQRLLTVYYSSLRILTRIMNYDIRVLKPSSHLLLVNYRKRQCLVLFLGACRPVFSLSRTYLRKAVRITRSSELFDFGFRLLIYDLARPCPIKNYKYLYTIPIYYAPSSYIPIIISNISFL